MLHNEKNSNSVGTQQNQPEDSFDLNKTMQNLPNSCLLYTSRCV